MKKNSLKLLALPLLASLTSPVFADDFYMGASLGQVKSSDFCDDVSDDLSSLSLTTGRCDDSDSAYKIFAGYNFSKNWGMEGAYTDLGEYSIGYSSFGRNGKAKSEVDAYSLAIVGTLPVSDSFDLFAKAGMYTGNADVRATFGTQVSTDDDYGTDGLVGVGVGYSFTDSVAVRAEWERYLADTDIDLLSAGLVFSF